MILSGLGMWILAVIYFINENAQTITLLVFGSIALSLGYGDYKTYKNKSAIGKERIAMHLIHMMAGTIAVVTAVLVTNVHIKPVWIWWLLPTVVITPFIFYWSRKILSS